MTQSAPLKIVHLISGAGGMYCGSCISGGTLASALARAGHDVTLQPLYTPVRTDGENLSRPRVAFGGLNVFLQQKFALFRKTPGWFDRLLDSPALLRWLGRFSRRTNPADLGALCVSMLRGPAGRQAKELDKLLELLAADTPPDIVHLSNALLAGLAGPIRRRLGVPVVVSLTGEDVFLEKLPARYKEEAYRELTRCAAQVDAFVSPSGYFARHMSDTLRIPRERIRVIPPGIQLSGYPSEPKPTDFREGKSNRGEFRVGYFSRVCHDKGLHVLIDAAERILADQAASQIRFDAAGYLAPEDAGYLRGIERRCQRPALVGRFHYAGSPDRQAKIAFLRAADVICLPSVFPESKALIALESWAAGTPVVAPRQGAFPELMEDTGAGVLFEPDDPADLARAVRELAAEPDRLTEMGQRGYEALRQRYHDGLTAQRTVNLYRAMLADAGLDSGLSR